MSQYTRLTDGRTDGVSEGLLRCVQLSVQNAVVRLVTGARRRNHITSIFLRQLHWLPVCQRVQFKIAVLVFQCLSGNTPTYLADDCKLISDVSTCRLRSTDTAMCVARHSHNTFDDRCFATTQLKLNSTILRHICSPES